MKKSTGYFAAAFVFLIWAATNPGASIGIIVSVLSVGCWIIGIAAGVEEHTTKEVDLLKRQLLAPALPEGVLLQRIKDEIGPELFDMQSGEIWLRAVKAALKEE